jgi:hypothetical protein
MSLLFYVSEMQAALHPEGVSPLTAIPQPTAHLCSQVGSKKWPQAVAMAWVLNCTLYVW